MESNTTLVPKERLSALEALEQNIPRIIETAISDYKKARLKMLHDKGIFLHHNSHDNKDPTFYIWLYDIIIYTICLRSVSFDGI